MGGNGHWLGGPKKTSTTTESREKDLDKGALDTTAGGEGLQRTIEHGERDGDGFDSRDDPGPK